MLTSLMYGALALYKHEYALLKYADFYEKMNCSMMSFAVVLCICGLVIVTESQRAKAVEGTKPLPVTPADRSCCRKHACHANDDLHGLTFDGRFWDFHIPGTYIMYRHKCLPFEVQADFNWCYWSHPTATCLVGVAIRAFNSVFIVKYNDFPRPNGCSYTTYAYGPVPSSMVIEQSFGDFKVTFMTGTVVEFSCGLLSLYTSITDFNQVQGLCGNDNDLCADDFTLRGDGLSTAPGATTCIPVPRPHPHFDDFGMSWRACDYENLFSCRFEDKTCCQDLYYCSCVERGNNHVIMYFGSQDDAIKQLHRCIPNDTTASIFKSSHVNGSNFCPGSSPIVNKTNPNLPTQKEEVNPNDARLDCDTLIRKDPVICLCLQKGILTNASINVAITECQTDIQLGNGNPDFTVGHLSSLQHACREQMRATAVDSATLATIQDGVCRNACNLLGNCTKGVCQCNTGAFADGSGSCVRAPLQHPGYETAPTPTPGPPPPKR